MTNAVLPAEQISDVTDVRRFIANTAVKQTRFSQSELDITAAQCHHYQKAAQLAAEHDGTLPNAALQNYLQWLIVYFTTQLQRQSPLPKWCAAQFNALENSKDSSQFKALLKSISAKLNDKTDNLDDAERLKTLQLAFSLNASLEPAEQNHALIESLLHDELQRYVGNVSFNYHKQYRPPWYRILFDFFYSWFNANAVATRKLEERAIAESIQKITNDHLKTSYTSVANLLTLVAKCTHAGFISNHYREFIQQKGVHLLEHLLKLKTPAEIGKAQAIWRNEILINAQMLLPNAGEHATLKQIFSQLSESELQALQQTAKERTQAAKSANNLDTLLSNHNKSSFEQTLKAVKEQQSVSDWQEDNLLNVPFSKASDEKPAAPMRADKSPETANISQSSSTSLVVQPKASDTAGQNPAATPSLAASLKPQGAGQGTRFNELRITTMRSGKERTLVFPAKTESFVTGVNTADEQQFQFLLTKFEQHGMAPPAIKAMHGEITISPTTWTSGCFVGFREQVIMRRAPTQQKGCSVFLKESLNGLFKIAKEIAYEGKSPPLNNESAYNIADILANTVSSCSIFFPPAGFVGNFGQAMVKLVERVKKAELKPIYLKIADYNAKNSHFALVFQKAVRELCLLLGHFLVQQTPDKLAAFQKVVFGVFVQQLTENQPLLDEISNSLSLPEPSQSEAIEKCIVKLLQPLFENEIGMTIFDGAAIVSYCREEHVKRIITQEGVTQDKFKHAIFIPDSYRKNFFSLLSEKYSRLCRKMSIMDSEKILVQDWMLAKNIECQRLVAYRILFTEDIRSMGEGSELDIKLNLAVSNFIADFALNNSIDAQKACDAAHEISLAAQNASLAAKDASLAVEKNLNDYKEEQRKKELAQKEEQDKKLAEEANQEKRLQQEVIEATRFRDMLTTLKYQAQTDDRVFGVIVAGYENNFTLPALKSYLTHLKELKKVLDNQSLAAVFTVEYDEKKSMANAIIKRAGYHPNEFEKTDDDEKSADLDQTTPSQETPTESKASKSDTSTSPETSPPLPRTKQITKDTPAYSTTTTTNGQQAETTRTPKKAPAPSP